MEFHFIIRCCFYVMYLCFYFCSWWYLYSLSSLTKIRIIIIYGVLSIFLDAMYKAVNLLYKGKQLLKEYQEIYNEKKKIM